MGEKRVWREMHNKITALRFDGKTKCLLIKITVPNEHDAILIRRVVESARYPSLHKKNFFFKCIRTMDNLIWNRICWIRQFSFARLAILLNIKTRNMLNGKILIVFGLVSYGVFARNADSNREFLKEASNKKHGGSMLMEIAKEIVQRSSTSSQVRWYEKLDKLVRNCEYE